MDTNLELQSATTRLAVDLGTHCNINARSARVF